MSNAIGLTTQTLRLSRENGAFAIEVAAASGERLERCYHCAKCVSGCPVADSVDITPQMLAKLVQLGAKRDVLASRAIWLCLGCGTCAQRCPNQVDLAAVMAALREQALREGVACAEPRIDLFHRVMLRGVREDGRVNELRQIAYYRLRARQLLTDMGLGIRLLRKGLLSLRRQRVRDLTAVHAAFERHLPKELREVL